MDKRVQMCYGIPLCAMWVKAVFFYLDKRAEVTAFI